jgi:hypothetical protein
MSSFSHLSVTSHNSNNGNPKKHCWGPAWFDSAIWEAARRFAGVTHRRIRRRRAQPGSWCCGRAQNPGPRDGPLENSVLGLRKSPSVHCSKPTAPLAYGWCWRKHHVFSASAVPTSPLGKLATSPGLHGYILVNPGRGSSSPASPLQPLDTPSSPALGPLGLTANQLGLSANQPPRCRSLYARGNRAG